MIHHSISQSDHWGVSVNTMFRVVLVQLQENGIQARISLTPEQADDMASELQRFASQARAITT